MATLNSKHDPEKNKSHKIAQNAPEQEVIILYSRAKKVK